MSRRLVEIAGVLFVFGTLTVALTWPQAAHLRTHVPSFDDSLLSIWRIAWIAHAIGSPASLADANIFHPEARTLAYTDAVLLQGLVATPFIRAGASPVLVYNLLILGSIALSGAAMYLLAFASAVFAAARAVCACCKPCFASVWFGSRRRAAS